MANKLSAQQRAEMGDLFAQMNAQQRRVMVYLAQLYVARKAAPSPATDAEIERIQREIREGSLPSVPSVQ